MPAIPKSFVGKFVFIGNLDNTTSTSMSRVDSAVYQKVKELYDGMFIYQRPTRHPTPQIPMAKHDYYVNITPLARVKHRARAAKQYKRRKRGKTRRPRKKAKKSRFEIGFLSKARTRFYTFYSQRRKDRAKGTGQKINRDRQRRLRERRKAFNAKFDKFKDSYLGKILGVGKKRKRGKRPKLRFGILDRVAPISKVQSTKSRQTSKEIKVKPGRLRRYSARGLTWEGSVFMGGLYIYWGVPMMGGGRFYNYASEVEQNPNAGTREGTGRSPYVDRTKRYIADECRLMVLQINSVYGEEIGSFSGVHGVSNRVLQFKSQY